MSNQGMDKILSTIVNTYQEVDMLSVQHLTVSLLFRLLTSQLRNLMVKYSRGHQQGFQQTKQ